MNGCEILKRYSSLQSTVTKRTMAGILEINNQVLSTTEQKNLWSISWSNGVKVKKKESQYFNAVDEANLKKVYYVSYRNERVEL